MRPVKVGIGVSAAAVVLAAGCATAPLSQLPPGDLVWPPPPETPRIRYVGAVHSEMDVGKTRSVAQRISDSLFGRPPLRALRKPYAVHADGRGRVYVADSGWRSVLVFDSVAHDVYPLGEGTLTNPSGVTSDSAGRVYVTDIGTHRVVIYDSAGRFVHAFGGPSVLVRPAAIAVNEALGRIYVADVWDHQIKVFRLTGEPLFTIGKNVSPPPEGDVPGVIGARLDHFWNRGEEEGEFRFPSQIALGPAGRLYVADTLNFRVQIFDPEGRFLRAFGGVGDRPGQFARPKGIAVDREGRIYVADAAFNNVQVFDPEGRLLLFFGKFGYDSSDLRLPAGMDMDGNDRIYVVDQYNSRIQMYQSLAASPGTQGSHSGAEKGGQEK